MKKKFVGIIVVLMLLFAGSISLAKNVDLSAFNLRQQSLSVLINRGTVTIYVNTSAIDGRSDLNDSQKKALKDRIIQHLKDNYEDAVGADNVTITNDPAQAGKANRTVQIQPGKDPTPPAGWGSWTKKSNTTYVYLGEFMNDSSVNGSFKNPDGSWNATKLGNAIGHTAGHEVGHSFSIGHNHRKRPKGRAQDNRSKMTVGTNINETERANASFKFDNHSKKVLKENWGKPACDSAPDYNDSKVLIANFWGNPSFPDKFDESDTFDALFSPYIEMPGWYELGILGIDTDNGVVDGNSNFDFIYKSSLSMDGADAEIISFLSGHHERTTWLLRGTETSPHPGEWFPLNPDYVILEEWFVNPDGDEVARYATMVWPEQMVYITFDSYSFDYTSSYNGFTYEYYTNAEPEAPAISGPTQGKAGTTYTYSFKTNDPDTDYVYYYIDWGDGEFEDWFGPYYSGEEVSVSHTWDIKDTYTISARAKDYYANEGDWGYLDVTMPKNQQNIQQQPSSQPYILNGFLQLLQRIMQNLK